MDRGPTMALSALFGVAIFPLLVGIVLSKELYFFWITTFVSFIAGLLILAFRCGVNSRKRDLIMVLNLFFLAMSSIMLLTVAFFILLLNSLYLLAYCILILIVAWEGTSELARRIP